MKPKVEKYDVAVIVGRFQTHELHEAHKDLFDSVIGNHERVIVFLGLSELRNTKRNPLDLNARRQMINETYPDLEIYYVHDMPSDTEWSKNLDSQIERCSNPSQTVLLYGGRDSFIKRYKGKFPTCELESEVYVSGTQMRKSISAKTKASKDFRAGVIWAANNRYDTVYTTVDIAILDNKKEKILLGKKDRDGGLYRFPGGFSDIKSQSFEDDAKREAIEETGIEISDPQYLGSFLVDDWRYRRENDKIKTIFFVAEYLFGAPLASDDLDEIRWFNLSESKKIRNQLVSAHQKMFDQLLIHLDKQYK